MQHYPYGSLYKGPMSVRHILNQKKKHKNLRILGEHYSQKNTAQYVCGALLQSCSVL